MADLDRSLAFYRDGLGFFVSERWEEGGKLVGVMLKAGGCHLGLSQDDFSKGRDRSKGVGFRIWCETLQDVDAIADRLRALKQVGLGHRSELPVSSPSSASLAAPCSGRSWYCSTVLPSTGA